MTADDILAHPALERCVRIQAQTLLSAHGSSPRISSPFATQQRWLMGHAALALYFRHEADSRGAGVLAERFLEFVERHDLASRNTASDFLAEMHKYELVRFVAGSEGKRHRPFEPAPTVLMAIFHWHTLHLATLDGLDSGGRVAAFHARPALLGVIQPLIADGLIGSGDVRKPPKTFELFTWINEGGVVMDRLIAGCRQAAMDGERILTDVTSISELSRNISLSRTHLGRKLAEAEGFGSLGWSGVRGRSPMWVSVGFRHEYHSAQAVKLAIIDAAFQACAASAELPAAMSA